MLNFPDMSPEELKKCKDEDYCDNYYFFIQIVSLGTTPEMEEIALRKGIIEDTIKFFEKMEEYEKCQLLFDKKIELEKKYGMIQAA